MRRNGCAVNARRVPTRSVWMGKHRRRARILAAIHLLADGVRVPGERLRRAGGIHYMIIAWHISACAALREAKRRTRAALSMWLFPWLSYPRSPAWRRVLIGMGSHPREMA